MDKRSEIGSLAVMTKEYRSWTPEQTSLQPSSPMEWLPLPAWDRQGRRRMGVVCLCHNVLKLYRAAPRLGHR